ncbi:MAG: hypothetical protein KF757_11205 [Phycisphaeraceae bacterium]|nr:hypothetical protein [Phycisphaeraceae bacterium]MCW5762255.1 hypothetical protein [Phycisphaeraceae bacterium]
MPVRKFVLVPAGIAVLAALPGCVITDIHEELIRVNTSLDTTNERLATLDAQLTQKQARLGSIDEKLRAIDDQLIAANTRLESLSDIDEHLASLDVHLEAIRQIVRNLDSTIPFLRLSGDKSDESVAEPDAPADGKANGADDPAQPK